MENIKQIMPLPDYMEVMLLSNGKSGKIQFASTSKLGNTAVLALVEEDGVSSVKPYVFRQDGTRYVYDQFRILPVPKCTECGSRMQIQAFPAEGEPTLAFCPDCGSYEELN